MQTDGISTTEFSLNKVSPLLRKKAWADALSQYFYAYDTSFPSQFASGNLTGTSLKGIRTAIVKSDPMVVRRQTAHIAKDATDGYFLLFPEGGPITLAQRGREVSLGQVEFCFVGTTEPYAYHQPTAETFHVLILPGSVVRSRKPNIEDSIAMPIASTSLARVFVDLAVSVCRNSTGIDSSAADHVIGQVIDLFALAVEGADYESTETTVQIAHRRRALRAIELNFRDFEFNIGSLSKLLNLSERYLQKIFAAKDETVSSLIRQRRLTAACELLDRRSRKFGSIADVAYSVGFADAAHFSRLFRQEFGLSPREFLRSSADH